MRTRFVRAELHRRYASFVGHAWHALCVGLLALTAVASGSGCTGMQVVTPSDRAVLEVTCTPEDAEVWVDGRASGRLDRLGGRVILTAGPRRIELVADGYLPHRFDLQVEAEQVYLLEVELWPRFEEVDGGRGD